MNEIVGAERDALLLQILKRLEDAKPHAESEQWEAAWAQALERFRKNPSRAALVPEFVREGPVRWGGQFWNGIDEIEEVLGQINSLARVLDGVDTVYEFGCGTGFNLVELAKRMPDKAYVGLDRSANAAQLVAEAAETFNLPILSGQFDMRNPKGDIPPGAGVFTFGAMEQLGEFRPFVDWLIAQRPKVVVHIEPIPELLDENNLIDWLSLQFHKKRGYTVGLLPYLQEKTSVQHVKRSHFGSVMLESYARIVWQPK